MFILYACVAELEELLLSLKQVQHCLGDEQSREDVEMVLQLVQKTDFQKAFSIHNAVAQHMHRASPPFPLTERAQGLTHEVARRTSLLTPPAMMK